MTRNRRFLLCFLIVFCLASFARAETSDSLLVKAQTIKAQLALMAADSSLPVFERAKLDLRIGDYADTKKLLPQLLKQNKTAGAVLTAEYLLDTYRLKEAAVAIAKLDNLPPSVDSDRQKFRWLFLTDNLKAADSLTATRLQNNGKDVAALLARGELLLRLLRYDEADSVLKKALALDLDPLLRSQALVTLNKVLVKQRHYQEALDSLSGSFIPETLTDDVLFNSALTLIFLSRVSEAIDLAEEAVRWNDWNEFAHYYLGNGYARKNYTQLHKEHPENFADSSGLKSLRTVKELLSRGEQDSARIADETIIRNHPQWVEPLCLLGYVHWTNQDFDSAEWYFRSAIAVLPEYGRAQNGLAKSLEGMRMKINVHRSADSTVFASKTMPVIPGIDKFILDWNSLSPRHQKQIALSVEPWKAYIPVLLESGNRYYIKPFYELLSESPGLETLRDQRINYDSRLWDDVRGCGGFTTVTGIEDVERSIYFSYNTVLHELTHQVHSLFPPGDLQKIQDAYQAAHQREVQGQVGFMSQYAGTSVQEYFAEGANSFFSPRRDPYDTREIVRERLFAIDTTLARLIEYFLPGPHLLECFPVGLVNAADDAIEKHDLAKALELAVRAHDHAPHNQNVLTELSHIESLLDHDSVSIAYADTLYRLYPDKADAYKQSASTQYFADGDLPKSVSLLESGLSKVDSSERRNLEQALGDDLCAAGQYAEAVHYYHDIIAERSTDASALWGLGIALGEQGKFTAADSAFQAALKERNGIISLRMDYARILIEAGKLDAAQEQVDESRLLDPEDEVVMATSGWIAAKKGDFANALVQYDLALKTAPWLTLASLLKVEALQKTGKSDEAKKLLASLRDASKHDIPEWVWVPHQNSFVPTRTWPRYLRDMLK